MMHWGDYGWGMGHEDDSDRPMMGSGMRPGSCGMMGVCIFLA
jgi:hypothetical protein